MDILFSSLESDSVFLVYDQGILKNLSSTDINGVRKASTHSKESIDLFYFLADNTNVEWAIHIKETESGLVYALGTVGKSDSAASYSAYMNSKPDISMHSHPDVMPTLIEELGSMGIYSW